MDLHTDGTYVKEKTDWLLMLKMEEENVQGGETAMLHLDDWEHLDSLTNDKVGKQNFLWGSPKSKGFYKTFQNRSYCRTREILSRVARSIDIN